MLVSLCMIAYNEANALSGLLRDISLQDYPHDSIEVVFVDSMSTDNTKKLMEKFRDDDYGFFDVVIVQSVKKNQATSWNRALMSAHGDIIIRVDAHARIPRNFVSRNVYNIKEGEYVVGGGRPNITSDVSSWNLTLLAAEESLFGSSIASYRRPPTEKEYLDSLFHAAYRREVIQKVGGFNENLGRTEDNEFHYRIRQAGYRLCCCPDIISYQHSRNNLKDMIRQKYSNGRWIGLTLSVYPGCLSYFHFVPFAFVVMLIICSIIASLGFPLFLYILGSVYGMFDIVNTVGCFTMKNVKPQFVFLPFIFPILHISYGVGTIVGLLQIPFWKRNLQSGFTEADNEEIKRRIAENTITSN